MYELKKNWECIYEWICWDRDLVLWKKNLPVRSLKKFEKHCSRHVILISCMYFRSYAGPTGRAV